MYNLVQCFKFVTKDANEVVFRHGDHGEHFYIIIKGIVGVWVPNSEIKGWKHEIKKYKEHLKWVQRLEAKYVKIKT